MKRNIKKQMQLHRRALDLLERVSYIRWNVSRVNLSPREKRKITLSLKRCKTLALELSVLHKGY